MTNVVWTPDNIKGDMATALEFIARETRKTVDDVKADYNVNWDFLRFVVRLKPNVQMYEINPVQGNDTLLPLERKLSQGHAFVAVAAGITLHIEDYNASSGAYSNAGNAFNYSYPDPKVWDGTKTGSKAEYLNLMTLYNGHLLFQGDSKYVKARIPLINSLNVPVATQDTSPVDLPAFNPNASLVDFCLPRLYPNIVINGDETNRVVLMLADGDTSIIDGSYNAAGSATNTDRTVVDVWVSGFYLENKPALAARCKV